MVTEVNVASEAGGELATFCKDAEDIKVHADYCPEDGVATVEDAPPLGWYVRFVFDELLDADAVEDLIDTDDDGVNDAASLKDLVEITCDGTEVAWTGFYDPSGSHLTFPPGPAIVANTDEFVATDTPCQASLAAGIVDKDGNEVPSEDLGPYDFVIAPLAIASNDPADGTEGVDPLAAPVVSFNAPIDPATIDGNFTLENANGGAVQATLTVPEDSPTSVAIVPDNALAEQTMYTVTVTSPAGEITDIEGGELILEEPFTFSFTTGDLVLPDGGMSQPDAAAPDAGVDAQ